MQVNLERGLCRIAFLIVALAWGAGLRADEGWKLIVGRDIEGTPAAPLIASVPDHLPVGAYTLDARGDGGPVDAQVFEDSGRWLVLVPTRKLAEGNYDLTSVRPGNDLGSHGVALVPSGHNLRIEIDGARFTEYRSDAGAKPFFYPIVGPGGHPYTRAYPMEEKAGEDRDHPHQRSFWFTHGSVNGVDFWSEQGNHGRIRETGSRVVISGRVAGRLHSSDDWVSPDGQVVCTDERVVTFYRITSPRIIDFEITLKASAGPVTFGDTKEGMFGLRVASSMDVNKKQGGRILNAEGLRDDAAWGKSSPWVDYSGPIDGTTVGIAILNRPGSFRHPTHWHVRTYGLFAANPFGWHDFGVGKSGTYTLPQGQSLKFAYRVIFHEGDAEDARIARQYQQYAEPPTISVERR